MIWNREPAMIVAALEAVIAVGLSFGLNMSPEQTGAILAAVAIVLGLVTRSQVAPVAQLNQDTV